MTTSRQKKHPCPDCKECLGCQEVKCRMCRGQGPECGQRRWSQLSIDEQIQLFEMVNRGEAPEGDY